MTCCVLLSLCFIVIWQVACCCLCFIVIWREVCVVVSSQREQHTTRNTTMKTKRQQQHTTRHITIKHKDNNTHLVIQLLNTKTTTHNLSYSYLTNCVLLSLCFIVIWQVACCCLCFIVIWRVVCVVVSLFFSYMTSGVCCCLTHNSSFHYIAQRKQHTTRHFTI
jgi:Flp pilus assembly protein TadB